VSGRRWDRGSVVVRREVLALELGDPPSEAAPGRGVWFGYPVHIVEDHDDALLSSVGPGAEFGFVGGVWPTATGEHPWRSRARWEGHGCLMVQRPGEMFAVWHYWHGANRRFLCRYINFQASFQRTAIGYDTQDFELDMVVFPNGTWVFKDREVLAVRVAAGQLSQGLVDGLYSSARRSPRNSTAGSCDGISVGRSGLRRQRGEVLTLRLSGT